MNEAAALQLSEQEASGTVRGGPALFRLEQGDALAVLRRLPTNSVHCCVTSPPYWGLRDYGTEPAVWDGEDGCEHAWEEAVRPAANGASNASKTNTGETLNPKSATRRARRSAFCARCGAWKGSLGLEPTPELYVGHLASVLREVKRVLREDGTLWLNLGDSYAGSWGGYSARAGGWRPGRSSFPRPAYASKEGAFLPPTAGSQCLPPRNLVGIPWRVALALQADGWLLRCDIIWHKPNCMPESVKSRPTRSHEYLFLLTKSPRYYYNADAVREPHAAGSLRRWREGAKWEGERKRGYPSGSQHSMVPGQMCHPKGRNRRSVWTVATRPFRGEHFAIYPPELVRPCILAGCPRGGAVLDPFMGTGSTGVAAKEEQRGFIGIELNSSYLEMARGRLSRP